MNTAVVTIEKFEETVQIAVTKVVPGTCFISGFRRVKNYNGTHQMMVEIVQLKELESEEVEKGYSELSDGHKTVRVWIRMTAEGLERKLPQVAAQKSGKELHELVGKLTPKQVLMILTPFDQITLNSGEIAVPTISVKQYSNPDGASFPLRLSEIINTVVADRTPEQEEVLNSAIMRTEKGEILVDIYGNQVYELNKFTYGEDENILVNKMPISKHYNYVFDMKDTLDIQLQSDICKTLSSNESMLWSPELIEKYEDKWDWNKLRKNTSIPWSLNFINKYADKLSCSESIWKTLKPYIDDKLIEEVFREINK